MVKSAGRRVPAFVSSWPVGIRPSEDFFDHDARGVRLVILWVSPMELVYGLVVAHASANHQFACGV